MRDLLRQTELMAREMDDIPNGQVIFDMDKLRQRSGASDLTLLTPQGRILVISSDDPTMASPTQPSEAILQRVRQGITYVAWSQSRQSAAFAAGVVPGRGAHE